MKILFIVGTFGSGRLKVFKKLMYTLKQNSTISVVGDGIGGTASADLIGGTEAITLEQCLYEIQQAITMFDNKDYYVFTGTGLTMHIRRIMEIFPDAGLYMLRRSDPSIELNQDNLGNLTSTFGVDEEWLIEFNNKTRDDLELYADQLGISWSPVDTPVFTNTVVPNWTDLDSTSNSTIEIAVYNIS